jgi:hypothetical protein
MFLIGFLLHAVSKQELTRLKIELEKKETKEELMKTRSDIRKTFSEMSTNLNGTSILFSIFLKMYTFIITI